MMCRFGLMADVHRYADSADEEPEWEQKSNPNPGPNPGKSKAIRSKAIRTAIQSQSGTPTTSQSGTNPGDQSGTPTTQSAQSGTPTINNPNQQSGRNPIRDTHHLSAPSTIKDTHHLEQSGTPTISASNPNPIPTNPGHPPSRRVPIQSGIQSGTPTILPRGAGPIREADPGHPPSGGEAIRDTHHLATRRNGASARAESRYLRWPGGVAGPATSAFIFSNCTCNANAPAVHQYAFAFHP